MTVERKLEEIESDDLTKQHTFLPKIAPLASKLRSLDDDELREIMSEEKHSTDIKKLAKACKDILDRSN